MPARWLAALPLFFVYATWFLILIISQPISRTYEEMDIGELPPPTQWFLGVSAISIRFYYLLMPLMFVAVWLFFSWSCRKHRRMLWTSFTTGLVGLVLLFIATVSFIMPLLTIGGLRSSHK